ncbi:hypothetical protein [Nonomuraea terrae]|nr:hypothetical protein [Nonomuraea terrae]
MRRARLSGGDETAFRTFNDIMHLATASSADDLDRWTRPLGELGEL